MHGPILPINDVPTRYRTPTRRPRLTRLSRTLHCLRGFKASRSQQGSRQARSESTDSAVASIEGGTGNNSGIRPCYQFIRFPGFAAVAAKPVACRPHPPPKGALNRLSNIMYRIMRSVHLALTRNSRERQAATSHNLHYVKYPATKSAALPRL